MTEFALARRLKVPSPRLHVRHPDADPAPPDLRRIEAAVRELLSALGEDPDRSGLADTPSRVARAFRDLCAGMRETPAPHLSRVFAHEAREGEMVALRDIEFTSLCEHHLLPFSGRAHIAYLPDGSRVVGLSKLARVVDVFARRPQLQERIGTQVADALVEHLEPKGVLVMIEARHSCLGMRGAKKAHATMLSTAVRGAFVADPSLRREAMALLRSGPASGAS